jgi:hypothetical protein
MIKLNQFKHDKMDSETRGDSQWSKICSNVHLMKKISYLNFDLNRFR